MRTARALERHLEEDIVARHCVTTPRAPSVASGRALNAPHTRAKWSRARAKWSLRVFVSAKVLVGCKSWSTLFKSGAYGQKDTGLDEPLKFVTTFPYRSEETEARRVPLCTPCASGYPPDRRRFGQPRVPHARVVSSRGSTGAPHTTSPNPPPGEHVTSQWHLLGTPPRHREEPLRGSPWWAQGSPGSPPRRTSRAGGAR